MEDLGVLLLRLTFGGLLTGHGSQKLLGWFGGFGLKGTAGWLESMNLKPGNLWASAASLSEAGGGALTALGLLHPLGPIATIGSMGMAGLTVHRGKPIWVTEGGAELPLTNIAIAFALLLSDPGRYSLDNALGLRVPRWLSITSSVAVLAGLAVAVNLYNSQKPAVPEEVAGGKVESGQGADSL